MDDIKHIVKISVDKSRSHVLGLLPYVRYNDDDSSVQYVTGVDENGNWGNFPYDIAKVESNSSNGSGVFSNLTYETPQKTMFDKNLESRLRYCDIILRYNRIQDALRNAVYTKAVSKDVEDPDSKITGKQVSMVNGRCGEGNGKANECCNYEISDRETYDEVQLSNKFTEPKTKYEFTPMLSTDFTQISKTLYRPNGVIVTDGDFICLVDNLDVITEANEWWCSWWEKWFGSRNAWNTYFPMDEGNFWFCRLVEKYFLGKVLVPEVYNGEEITGVKVPDYVYYCEVNNRIDWFEKRFGTVNKKTEQEMKDNGGMPFYRFLKSLDGSANWITSIPSVKNGQGFSYATPFISFPVTIESEYDHQGIYESYLPMAIDFNESKYVSDNNCPTITRWIEDTGCFAESKLVNVLDENATEVGGITGVWVNFNEGEESVLFECTYHIENSSVTGKGITTTTVYEDGTTVVTTGGTEEVAALTKTAAERVILATKTSVQMNNTTTTEEVDDPEHGHGVRTSITGYTVYEYGWWECKRQRATSSIICGDGESVGVNSNKYRTITILECFKNMVSDPRDGDKYYFMVKKDNGLIFGEQGKPVDELQSEMVTFRIPYKEDRKIHNLTSIDSNSNIYIGDCVDSIVESDGKLVIQYTIGATFTGTTARSKVEHTGVTYRETYPFLKGKEMITYMDGFENIKVYYDTINTEDFKESVYSEEYDMYRTTNRAEIVGMEVGTLFNPESMMMAPLITKDGSNSFSDDPKKVLDVTFNRGAAAAFESHFKLSECNTFEDLANYGNNHFNL